jgi:GTP-binding protein EngB required for normal cell division
MRSVIDTYLSKRINLYGVFQVIDASVVTKLDMEMGQYLSHKFIHHFLIINKVDKLNQSEKANLVQRIKKFMKIDEKKIILISVRKD